MVDAVDTNGLDRLFNPRSIALVGASERSIWCLSAFENLRRFGYSGSVHLVNPKGGTIFGQEAFKDCASIGEPVDAALLMVPEAALDETIKDVARAGIGSAVLLTAGLAETGHDGALRQQQIAQAARAHGIRLLGPNCLGFINYSEKVALWTNQARRPFDDLSIAVVSQSGSVAAQVSNFAYQQRIGISHVISTGNEADIDIVDAVNYLITQDSVKSIALFIETVRRPDAFVEAIRRAQDAAKVIVVLKVGASEASAKAAQAHTGSLVGDDKVFSAVCRKYGVPRVRTVEELVTVADLIARLGPVKGSGFGLVGMSGGMCEIATDIAEAENVAIAPLTDQTIAKLTADMPAMATPSNPLDLTGAAMIHTDLIRKGIADIGQDENVSLVAYFFDAPNAEGGEHLVAPYLEAIGKGCREAGKPALMISNAFIPVTSVAKKYADKYGYLYSGAGIALGVNAFGHLMAWSKSQQARRTRKGPETVIQAAPTGEREVLAYLGSCGVPVIPGTIAGTADDAVAAADTFGAPVVLKIASRDIEHKTEVGGVRLNLTSADEIRLAYADMMENVSRHAPNARIDGVVVSPMRSKATELFVGTMRDPEWGPVIAVGLGGIFVEALKDTSLRTLPIDRVDVLEMLDELRGTALLDGFRGSAAVDRSALADAIVDIGNAALALGERLVSLEVNPLTASGDSIEALDALTVWA